MMIIVMMAGTGVIMWLGELITERGIGNGMSLLIFTSIAARLPEQLLSIVDFASIGTNDLTQYTMAADRLDGNLAGPPGSVAARGPRDDSPRL